MNRTLKDALDNSSTRQPPASGSPSSSQNRFSRSKQLQLELKYKLMNEEIRRLKESGINSKEVVEKSKLLRKKLKQANDLSKTAFDTGSQKCIEYDAEYFFNGAEVNHIVVKSLQVDSQAFDLLFFAEKLKTFIAPDSRIRDDTIDENELTLEHFSDLGKRFGYLINSAPILTNLYGAFEPGEVVIPAKQRRTGPIIRNRLNEPTGSAKKPKSKEGIDETDDLKNGKEVERVYNELKSIYDEQNKPIPFFKVMVKPKSFCETVESIFYSAFLIKEGVVSAKQKKNSTHESVAVLEPLDPEEMQKCQERMKQKKNNPSNDSDDENEEISSHQSILSFCEDDWKSWRVHD